VSRSGGPGGQHVNKVSSRVMLNFDVLNSPSLNEQQRERILKKLKTRINKQGILRVVSQKHRSQRANKLAAIERFAELLKQALSQSPPRIKTKTPKAVKQRRLNEKSRQSKIKQERSKKIDLDD
jgi:ribosome-associated protein